MKLGTAQRDTLQALADGGWISGMTRTLYRPATGSALARPDGKVREATIDRLYDLGYITAQGGRYIATDTGKAAAQE